MASSPSRLRHDLKVSRQKTANGTSLVIKDPVSRNFFRLQGVEAYVAEQLDGATPLEVVRQRVEEKFAASLPAGTLDAFVESLDRARLLDRGDAKGKRTTDRRVGPRGSLLYLRYALLDPDRLLSFLVRRVQFFFTPGFLLLSAGLILWAVGIALANGPEFAQDVQRLFQLHALPFFVLVLLVVVSAHELAHGLTCQHFGGEVHEMGVMLLYFQPAFYCNVSDAWLFPEKSKRMWVSFAGAYFELFLWAIATFTWRVTDVDTWVNYVALVVMTISGVKILFNFNPFIKLDGYYLLSDYVGIPNLRRKAFAYVGATLKKWAGFGSEITAEISRRDRRIYFAYGLTATVVSFSLLICAFVKVGGVFVQMGQPALLGLLATFVGLRSRQRLRALFGRSSDPSEPGDDDSGTTSPTDSSRASKPTKKKKRRRSWWPRIIWSTVAAAALAVLFLGRMELRIGGSFNVLPEQNADVRTEVEGIIEHVYVDEGDSVRAGDVIARLSGSTLRVELDKIEAEIQQNQANLRKLLAGPTTEEIEVGRAVVARVEEQLLFANGKVSRLGRLTEMALVARQELEIAQEQVSAAESELAEARARLDVLLQGPRPEEIDATRSQIDRLEAQRRYLEKQLGLLEIVSPVAGIVATPSRLLKATQGQLVGRGDLIAKVFELSAVTAQVHVSEMEIGDVRVGQQVVLKVRAYPDATFRGTVVAIATAAEGLTTDGGETPVAGNPSPGSTGGTFIVSTVIEDSSHLLKPGMTGHAKVLAGERRIIGLVTRRLARMVKVEFWSWW